MKSKYLFIIPILFLLACKHSLVGKTFKCTDDDRYIKFIDDKRIEWEWHERFRPEECAYTIEGDKIRTVRTGFGNQIRYLNIVNKDSIEYKGWIYKLKE